MRSIVDREGDCVGLANHPSILPSVQRQQWYCPTVAGHGSSSVYTPLLFLACPRPCFHHRNAWSQSYRCWVVGADCARPASDIIPMVSICLTIVSLKTCFVSISAGLSEPFFRELDIPLSAPCLVPTNRQCGYSECGQDLSSDKCRLLWLHRSKPQTPNRCRDHVQSIGGPSRRRPHDTYHRALPRLMLTPQSLCHTPVTPTECDTTRR